jgi:hypothetical protein
MGILTVADRIAQTAVKMWLEPRLDPLFRDDAYGYRPGKSALEAIAVTRRRCWDYDWVVEFLDGATPKEPTSASCRHGQPTPADRLRSLYCPIFQLVMRGFRVSTGILELTPETLTGLTNEGLDLRYEVRRLGSVGHISALLRYCKRTKNCDSLAINMQAILCVGAGF